MSVIAEATDVEVVIDVARRRSHEHEPSEQVGLFDRGEDADHRRHRMPDEDDVAQAQLVADGEHVLGVPVEGAVTVTVVGRRVGTSGTGVIEQDDRVIGLEARSDEAPHLLVAAEPVREHDRLPIGVAGDLDVMSVGRSHGQMVPPPSRDVPRHRRASGRERALGTPV